SDPYDSLDLGAAYHNSGSVERALPLYRQTIANGKGIYPADVTRAEVQGMPLDEIAKWNMRLAGYDEYGNRITVSSNTPAAAVTQTTTTQSAILPKSYQVFFDFDKSDLTPDARALIRAAADNAMKGGSVKISLTGHTDTSGSKSYNLGLSQRRADAVKNEMMA